jgi:hypothetical protein
MSQDCTTQEPVGTSDLWSELPIEPELAQSFMDREI